MTKSQHLHSSHRIVLLLYFPFDTILFSVSKSGISGSTFTPDYYDVNKRYESAVITCFVVRLECYENDVIARSSKSID